MRTTVTIEHDVELLLRQAMRQRRQSFKATLNQALRQGLAAPSAEPDAAGPPAIVPAQPMSLLPGIDPTRLNQIIEDLDVEAHLAVTRDCLARHKA